MHEGDLVPNLQLEDWTESRDLSDMGTAYVPYPE